MSDALAGIAIATQRLPDHRSAWDISISCTPTFASRLLIPGFAAFSSSIRSSVSLDSSRRHVGFHGRWLRSCDPHGTRTVARALLPRGSSPNISCRSARRHLAASAAPVREPFLRASLLHVTSVTEDWASGCREPASTASILPAGLRFDGIQLAFDAAQEGLGIAIGRRPLIDPELARGESRAGGGSHGRERGRLLAGIARSGRRAQHRPASCGAGSSNTWSNTWRHRRSNGPDRNSPAGEPNSFAGRPAAPTIAP